MERGGGRGWKEKGGGFTQSQLEDDSGEDLTRLGELVLEVGH